MELQLEVVNDWALAMLLLSIRLAPLVAFAPPLSLLNLPLRVRVLLTLSLAACLVPVSGIPQAPVDSGTGHFLVLAAGELVLGVGIAFALQAAFASLYFAGRLLDIQSGFGLATVLDPATRAPTPLIGSFFAFGAAAVFFAADGHHELLRVLAATLQVVPVGAVSQGWTAEQLIAQAGLVFSLGLATAAAGVVVLFLTDVALGFMSRTLPQMNILVLGLQVKSVVLVLTLVLMTGLLAPAFLRATESGLRFIGGLS